MMVLRSCFLKSIGVVVPVLLSVGLYGGTPCRAETEKTTPRAAAPPRAASIAAGTVAATSVVNLRKGPGIGFPKVDIVSEGEMLTVLKRGASPATIDGKSDFWYRVKRHGGAVGWVFGAYLATAALGREKTTVKAEMSDASGGPPSPSPSPIRPVDATILKPLLASRGFEAPDTFKALIIEIVKTENGSYVYYPMDFDGTSTDRDDWWPASTVKLYAAVAALEKARAMGFTPKASLTFEYEEGPVTQSMKTLIDRAITDSKNPEFDRLVEFVGARRLNRVFLTEAKGIRDTVMMRCYSGRVISPELGKCSNRHSPPIEIVEGHLQKHLSEKFNTETYECEREGNCTTLRDLTEVLRRVMMHETLPKEERYKLGATELNVLRGALKGKWARGGVNNGIRAVFKGRPIEIFHKGGYADKWFSDNVFLRIMDTDEQWIVAMANRPGRESLDEAALFIATLIADGTLSAARARVFGSSETSAGEH